MRTLLGMHVACMCGRYQTSVISISTQQTHGETNGSERCWKTASIALWHDPGIVAGRTTPTRTSSARLRDLLSSLPPVTDADGHVLWPPSYRPLHNHKLFRCESPFVWQSCTRPHRRQGAPPRGRYCFRRRAWRTACPAPSASPCPAAPMGKINW